MGRLIKRLEVLMRSKKIKRQEKGRKVEIKVRENDHYSLKWSSEGHNPSYGHRSELLKWRNGEDSGGKVRNFKAKVFHRDLEKI